MLGSETANVANVERLRRELGLDLPWHEQHLMHMKGLTGDMGRSITYKRPVVDMIRERFNNTLILAASSTLFALVISLPLGIAAAYQRRSWIDYGASTLAMLGVSLPSFYLGLLLIIVFGLNLGWLPIRGMASRSASLGTYIRHLILPSVTLGSGLAGILTRLTRSSVLEALSQDYVRTARAKGVGERKVLYARPQNALLPVTTTFGPVRGRWELRSSNHLPGPADAGSERGETEDILLTRHDAGVRSRLRASTLVVDICIAIDPRIRCE